jgi:hypothetical protein
MRKIFFFVMILVSRHGYAQVFGGNPPSVRWRQIDTDSVRVIFPRGLASDARHVAATVSYLDRHNRVSIGPRAQKLNIILENRTVESNGFVSLSPFRAVFQVTPPADNFSLGSLEWTTLLSLHEYRHGLQNMNFRSGIGRTFYDLFGENGQAVVTNALIPDWFWEGDAVFMETALSGQGRGRLAGFLEPFKSLDYAGISYPYAKIRNGSYRDMVPDRYPLGYMMTAYGRNTLGVGFWRKATQQALLNRKFIRRQNRLNPGRPYHSLAYGIYPLSSALHYLAGTKIPGFYRRSLDYFQKDWDSVRRVSSYTPVRVLRRGTSRSVLNYRYPQALASGSVLAVKHGYAYTPRIVRIDTAGTESLVVKMGNNTDDYFSRARGKIVWSEVRPDARWGWTDYSVLRIYDTLSRRTRTLTRRSRYFSAALSPDARRIVAVERTGDEESRLVVLDAATGALERVLPRLSGVSYTYPVFTRGGGAVLSAVRDSAGRMAVVSQPADGGAPRVMTPFWLRALGPPHAFGGDLFFPADFSGVVALYRWDTTVRRLFRIATRPLGDYSLAVDTAGKRIVFDEYSARGYFLASVPLTAAAGTPVDTRGFAIPSPTAVARAIQAEGGPVTGKVSDRDFAVRAYRPLGHLVRIHSWSFLPTYPEVGLYLQSQDVLNSLQWTAGGGYNVDEQSPYLSATLAYGGLLPVLYGNFTRTFHRTGYVSGHRVTWSESDASAGFAIPLSLTSNRYGRALSVGGFLHRNSLNFDPSPALKTTFSRITYLEGTFSFSNGLLRSVQQVYPSFGQSLSVDYERSLSRAFAQQVTLAGNLFLPGVSRNHSLYLTGAYGVRDTRGQYKFSDRFLYASGYHAVPYSDVYTLGADYQLPLAYPDWGATWAYLLRIRLDGFFNYTHARMQPRVTPGSGTYRSLGATLYFDTQLFSSLSIPWGIRYSYLLDRDFSAPKRTSEIQLVVPLTFF